jgi:predicted Zn-dependent protease
MPIPEQKAKQIVDRVLGHVAKIKGAQAVVSLVHRQAGNTRFAVNEITSAGDVTTQGVSVQVSFGQRAAVATSNQLDDASLADVVARAARMARLTPENPEAMPPLGPQKYVAIKDGVDAATAAAGAALRGKAPAAAIAQATAAKLQIAGFYEHGVASTSLATSAGLWGHYAASRAAYSCTARTADGTGSGWAGGVGRATAELDVDALAKVAVDKAVRAATPRKLDAGLYTVVLEPAAVASLLGFLFFSADARRADEGRSFFSKAGGGNKIGDKLFPDTITVRTDPTDVAVGGAPFDGEGLAQRPMRWIDKGVVANLVYNRFWAKKLGKPATAFPSGITFEGGGASRDALIKGVKRGVLITRFWYLRMVDPQTVLVTGLTRDGTFLIENGEVVAPVNNFRFNHSPITMLAKCDGLAAAIAVSSDDGPTMRAPALRTSEFNLASVSEAV